MKVTLDTNVIISGTFWTGDSYRVLEAINNFGIELVISREILDEYLDVIDREEIIDKVIDKKLIFSEIIDKVLKNSTIVEPVEKLDIIKEDPDDNIVLECALAGNVDYIVSQDNHLLGIKEFREIKILKPEDFLKLLDFQIHDG